MKTTLKISICLNLALLGGVIYLLAGRPKEAALSLTASSVQPVTQQTMANPSPLVPPDTKSFRWHQLGSTKNYRIFIANLRAAGCPEPTIQDIVRGDTARAFAWERQQLGLDGYGTGPWSQWQETHLVASLLNGPLTAAGSASQTGSPANSPAVKSATQGQLKTAPASYPLFLQTRDWGSMGFDAGQQAAIAQVRQQFQNAVNGLNQAPNDPVNQNASTANPDAGDSTPAKRWKTALQNADDQLHDLLGAQAYMAYQQQQYYLWFQPQVIANVDGGNLVIDPGAFSLK